MRSAALGALLFALASAPLQGQTWRTLDAAQRARDTAAVTAHVEYAAGKLELKPAAGDLLYHANVRYDADRSEPLARYDSVSRAVTLGVHLRNVRFAEVDSDDAFGTMHAELTSRAPVDLSLELGAVEADLQLGGLRLTDLSLRCGAADVVARFDQPNRERLRAMTLQVGAAQVRMIDVANSGVSRIDAEVGAGSLTIDLAGTLTRDVEISATLAVGGLTLNVSPDDGIFVDERSLVGGFKKDGFVKKADGWYSVNFESATKHVRVRVRTFMGTLTLTGLQR